ncbi:Phosphatidylcholine-sterol O-acyltransferase [Giardia duodenalis]|uniref:Phosphatidylcholine-sterol O-acyltransferase n=1 Tax=Giardia intestinalis TaxID=5741 RepID=V6T7Y6_GIAIN|nr:Phosphatidylcholine-sterol O-acyltransferase [Giardia intestinalis]
MTTNVYLVSQAEIKFQTMTEFFPAEELNNLEGITDPDNLFNPPIILVPGVCGSLLVADNNEVAWLNETLTPYPQASAKLMQYLYGSRDSVTNKFVSFIERQGFSSVKAVPGLSGCSRLLNHKLTRLPGIAQKKLGIYYETFAVYLAEKFGYKEGLNLFAFTYDWRQALHIASIQSAFDELLKAACQTTGQRCIVVGHSMGGLLVTTYMRLHPDWNDYIAKFVSLGVPYAGSGASGLIAAPYGYNLRMPFRPRVARGIQGPGGSMACLNLPAIDASFKSYMFLRIVDTPQVPLMATITAPQEKQEQSRSIPHNINPHEPLKLNRQLYRNKTPDIPALLLMEIENMPNCIGENFEQVIALLARYCEPGFVIHPPLKFVKEKYVPFEAALDALPFPSETVNELSPDTKVSWRWMVYSPGIDMYPRNAPIHGFQDLTTMQEYEQQADEIDYGSILKESEVPGLRSIIERASLRDQNISLRSIILQHCLSEVGTGRKMLSHAGDLDDPDHNPLDNLDTLLLSDASEETPSIVLRHVTSYSSNAALPSHANPLESGLTAVPICNPLTGMTLEGPTKLVGDNNLTIRTRDNTRLPLNTDYIDMQPEPGASTEGFINSVGHAFTPPHYSYRSRLQTRDNFKKMIIIVKDMISQYKSNLRQHADSQNRSISMVSQGAQGSSTTSMTSDSTAISGASTSNRFLYRPLSTLNFKEIGGPEIQEQYSIRCTALLSQVRAKPYADLLGSCVKPYSLDELIYKPSLEYWNQSKEILSREIVYPEDTELFRFYSLNGSNLQTAVHAYYDEILSSLYELAYRKPKFIFTIGDGTVPLISSLSDPIPDRYVDDRVAFPEMGHFEMLQSKEVFELLVSFMGIRPCTGIHKSKK